VGWRVLRYSYVSRFSLCLKPPLPSSLDTLGKALRHIEVGFGNVVLTSYWRVPIVFM
jgi:hypothetical protein